jgi:hypothetical protein
MGLGGLFTLGNIVRSNLKDKKLAKLLRDRGVDENTIEQAEAAVGYLSLSEKDKINMYRRNPSLDRKDMEEKMTAVLFYIFQYLEVAELVIGNREKAMQAHNEAKAMLARVEDQKNKKVLSLSQVEARVVRFSIINYVDKLTMSDEERKELKEIADFMKIKTDPISSRGDISLHISNDVLIELDAFLHFFMGDSANATIHGSIGADSFIGDTGVRLSEMSAYTHIIQGLIERISKQIE